NAGDQQPGCKMGCGEQDGRECDFLHAQEGGEGTDDDQQQDHRSLSVSERCGSLRAEQRQSQEGDKTEKKGGGALPGAENTAHAGFPPIPRSTLRAPIPTIVTSMAASTEPAISAAHMSIVWL